jgi:hypothetical protein
MGHKASPRRTGEMKKQIVRWPFAWTMKAPKKSKSSQKQKVVVHTPPAW